VAKLVMALSLSLRGSVCIYQGEELGLPEAEVPYERMRDPYGLEMWPAFKGRDGCRTPMPWTAAPPHAGFSDHEPWLPVPDQHRQRAVAVQAGDPSSVLSAYRTFLRWRRTQPALRRGEQQFVDTPEPGLVLVRELADDRVLAAFNLSAAPVELDLSAVAGMPVPLDGHGFAGADFSGRRVRLPGHGAGFARVT
jgi:alpha-glucosidase